MIRSIYLFINGFSGPAPHAGVFFGPLPRDIASSYARASRRRTVADTVLKMLQQRAREMVFRPRISWADLWEGWLPTAPVQ